MEAAAREPADLPRHWNDVYGGRATEQLTWYQPRPVMSLELIAAAGTDKHAAVIDVGGGASSLVDELLDAGFDDVTVLDVSRAALGGTRRRLGPAADAVDLIATDLLAWSPPRHYSLWHDRAVFHFLVDEDQRVRYVEILREALAPGGHVVMATFAADGPFTCSGLPVCRYTPAELATELGSGFETVTTRREEHVTPTGAIQPFTWLLARRHSDTGR